MHTSRDTLTGIFLALLGCGLLAGDYFINLEAPLLSLPGYGLLGVGILVFMFGLGHSLFQQIKSDEHIHRDDQTLAASALIRCMVAMSIADDHLDEREIRTIVKIYEQLIGNRIEDDVIRETAQYMQEEGIDLETELKTIRKSLPSELRRKILKASLYILAADGVMDAGEEKKLDEIRQGLGLSKSLLRSMKNQLENKN